MVQGDAQQGSAELEQAYETAQKAWPSVALDRPAFESYVRERIPAAAAGENGGEASSGRAPVPGKVPVHTTDLYLACACVRGVPGAFEAFQRRYLERIGVALRGIDPSPAFADEVHQLLWERLFVSPKLAGYSGRGSLESWVSVAAQRIALSLKRRERPHRTLPESVAEQFAAAGNPEVSYLKARYRPEFEEALTAALATLPERERIVFRLHLVGGASHARIAGMYRVNQSTVTRWIAGARDQVWRELRRELSERLGIAAREVESLVRAIKSDFHLSVSRILGNACPDVDDKSPPEA